VYRTTVADRRPTCCCCYALYSTMETIDEYPRVTKAANLSSLYNIIYLFAALCFLPTSDAAVLFHFACDARRRRGGVYNNNNDNIILDAPRTKSEFSTTAPRRSQTIRQYALLLDRFVGAGCSNFGGDFCVLANAAIAGPRRNYPCV